MTQTILNFTTTKLEGKWNRGIERENLNETKSMLLTSKADSVTKPQPDREDKPEEEQRLTGPRKQNSPANSLVILFERSSEVQSDRQPTS